MSRRSIAGRLFLSLSLALAACRSSPTPVGELTAPLTELSLAWPQFTELRVQLRATGELPAAARRPLVFVHLLDEPGSVLRTFDHPLPGEWVSGRRFDYAVRLFQSALAEPLPPGRYLLTLGLYSLDGGRYALRTSAAEVARQEYQVATVIVPPPGEGDPRARFSESWLPVELGADRQVLGRRTLRGGSPGTLQFGPLAGASTLFLNLELPHREAAERVELLEEGSQPKVVLSASCGGAQAEVTGEGAFDVDLELPGGEGPETCEVTVLPNFQVRHADRAEKTSVRLGVLAWRPGGRAKP